ncbi:hypothetical protein CPARK_000111000 [cyanobacterium endosymbiont of Braarudosphaera bigelowii]|uniref:Uncharacterized protein n=2 Tax=Candidatus Atelocyanobacterium thalassae TaxID=713887 RepID=A0A086CI87_9CHRO|nr:MAG: hypothetical protein ucyna2_00280 [Candidatus Atelocyanobacterium thalassa isolate SIO64986]BDA40273.1 hypothetical protein CPARK_000111000 [cyanobacterium endosymbiont of Braarudosphaera bigelowii]
MKLNDSKDHLYRLCLIPAFRKAYEYHLKVLSIFIGYWKPIHIWKSLLNLGIQDYT